MADTAAALVDRSVSFRHCISGQTDGLIDSKDAVGIAFTFPHDGKQRLRKRPFVRRGSAGIGETHNHKTRLAFQQLFFKADSCILWERHARHFAR